MNTHECSEMLLKSHSRRFGRMSGANASADKPLTKSEGFAFTVTLDTALWILT